jgi:hypothetical protein
MWKSECYSSTAYKIWPHNNYPTVKYCDSAVTCYSATRWPTTEGFYPAYSGLLHKCNRGQFQAILQSCNNTLSLWGASCCVTYICYINILHKNYTCDPQTQLNFFTLPKISLHVSAPTGHLQVIFWKISYSTATHSSSLQVWGYLLLLNLYISV